MYWAVYSGRESTGWGENTGGAKFEASFPTANLFTANFPRTIHNSGGFVCPVTSDPLCSVIVAFCRRKL